ncbi:hypothetical protein WJX74_003928 [Apatococcus lobatus]|uniref:Uncharacterized protein n=1 Tax=Apatococcus lobatus TaxID=904363 RepID=A0AAW1QIS0_9CHLO
MKGSSRTIINVSSTGGCLTGHAQTASPAGPAGKNMVLVNSAGLGYCVTKAGLNMETLVLANQLKPEGFTVVSLTPGFVNTEMGKESERLLRLSAVMKKGPITPAESVTKQLQIIKGLTPADNGKYISVDGNQLPY